MARTVKDVAKKIANNALKGEIKEMINIPTPAYVHQAYSHLDLQATDLRHVHHLTDAIQIKDPLERLKKITTFYVSVQHLAPTQASMKAPLNPILGETLHREMETGEILYME